MRYFKIYKQDGTLLAIGTGPGGVEITESEYKYLEAEIEAASQPEEPDSDEISAEEALDILTGGASE